MKSGIGAKICQAQAQGGPSKHSSIRKKMTTHEKKNSFCQKPSAFTLHS